MKRRFAKLLTAAGLGLFLSLGVFGTWLPTIAHAAEATTDTLALVGDETGLSTTDPKIIVGNIIRTGLGVIGIILVCIIVYGGFVWMTAAGQAEKVDKAKQILINAVVGLIIILLSWSIATFVISSLIGATGTGGGGGGGGSSSGGYGLGGGSSSTFNVTGYSPKGAVTIRNIVPRITFSKTVDEATVDGNIVIADASGTAVAGAYVTTGNVVKFTPAALCPDPNSDRFCFDENAVFTVTVSSSVLSSSGTAIVCTTSLPCSSTFTSGSLVDTEDPLANITVPEGTVPTNSSTDFQVSATDDAGVAGADFLVDDEWQDSISADGATSTTVSTIIDTASFVDGTKYTLKATVIDFAGNEDSDTVSVRAKPEWCFNGALDADLGETGVDCGGDSSLTTYCGACDGSSCTTGDECSSGVCTEGVCTSNPAITDVSPQDGAVGTYVTISGTDFSANTGTVLFVDAAGTGTIEAEILSSCGGGWSDTQVVVTVPEGAGDGPVTITTANDVSDSTDDENGALVPNFDVNAVSHPGLCSLSKTSGTSTSALTLSGSNFGSTQSTSTVVFSSTSAGSYTSWADETVKVTVPQASDAAYDVGVVVGGLSSNTLSFSVVSASVDASTITDISPGEGGIGQYVTISGTNFGSAVGTVTFTSSTGETATGSIDFPSVCTSDYWDADQVIVIVPEAFDDASATALSVGDYTVTVTNQQGVTSSSVDFTVTDTAPTPGICGITASADIGGTVTITGDNFGLATDTVTFYSGVTSILATSWNNSTVELAVPVGSVTGPVTIMVAGFESNGVNLTVGATSEVSSASVVAAYAWDFSTGEIMKVPAVVSECSADTVSAVPDNKFSVQGEICVNAVVYAEFTTLMNEATVADAVSVLKCTAAVSSPSDNPCTTTEAVNGTPTVASSTSASRVTWVPTEEFSTNTTYQVTITSAALSLDSIAMARDEVWEFTTSPSSAHCVIDRVTVTPPDDTIAVIYDTAGFGANAGTGCVVVDSSDYTWDWSVDSYSYVDFNATADDECVGDPTACATLEAFAEGTTFVTATAKNASDAGDVSDDSDLLVNFTDPYLSNYTPNCTEACTNALVGGTFNTAMVTADITTGEHVLLYSCSNELCTNLTLIDSNPACVYDSADTTSQHCLGFAFPEEPLQANAYYRVIVSGEVTSESGVALIRTNYGSDFSWTFRVREDGTACAVERIALTPPNVVVADVGAARSFTASAFGAADSCSTSGQELVGTNYTWGWTNPIPDDEQNTSTVNYTAAWMSINSELFDGGPEAIPEGCSAQCTPIGSSPYQAVCGDGVLDRGTDGSGEECDEGDTTNGDGCSSTCLYEGSAVCSFTCSSTGTSCTADSQCVETCDSTTLLCSISGAACAVDSDCAFATATCGTTGTNCCGNVAIEKTYPSDIAENCDDGNITNGDGCSSGCLAEGSASVGATCGNSDIAFDATTKAGEVCDDGNNASGDGCSRLCLPEGSQSLSALGNSLCGDGEITSPYETCDDGNVTDNDGCSSTCVREGRSACTATVTTNCCGNATLEQDAADSDSANSGGEDCDPAAGVEGCSNTCTYEGSSVEYASPSVCGDGVQGIGEFPSCESGSSSGDGKPDPIQVAYMADESVREVNPETMKATGIITVSVAEAPGLYTTSDFTLTCSAQNDQDCSDPSVIGVGISNCCVPRPILTSSAPSGESVCRNAGIYSVFSEEMNKGSFTHSVSVDGTTTSTPYMYLKLNLEGTQTCPTEYTALSLSKSSFFARIMRTVRTFFLGENAQAAAAGTADECILPIDSYTQTDVSTDTETAFKVSLVYKTALEASSSYSLIIIGDENTGDESTDGVTSALGAGMSGTQQIDFRTGTDICTLDEVVVQDTSTESPNTFTTTSEFHTFTATPVSYSNNTRQEITELPGVYDWTWSGWESSDETLFTAAQGGATALDTATVVSVGDDGNATVIATATIDDASVTAQVCSVTTSQTCSTSADCPGTETCVTKTSSVSGTSDVTALLCENPWPVLTSFPWTDNASGDSGAAVGNNGYMNFSVSYCKDYGSDSGSCSTTSTTTCNADSDCPTSETCSMHDFSDDLPSVNVVLAPVSPSSSVLKEYLFEIDSTSSTSASSDAGDVIGVRILSNADYLSPMAWYEAQGFSGSPSETTIDGFQAVTDERSTYIAMANSTGTSLYANILVISYNEGASVVTMAVYDEMLANLSFLINVTDTAVCSATATTSCSADKDCPSGETCLDDKAKITRDTDRFADLKDIAIEVSAYSEENRSCSTTTAQTCSEDSDCPDNETCESLVPTLSSGTAVRALVSSAWGSWTETFEGGLDGGDLPTDPLNNYTACSGYDSATCVNQTSGAYSCPVGSYVYHYRAFGSRDYELAMTLEYVALPWANTFDADTTDEVTYYTSSFCDGDVYGTSSVCGDGIIGINGSVTEVCEIGDVQAQTCVYDAGTDASSTADDTAGSANADCNSTCSGYTLSSTATCSANSCGDGVVNGSETCDDGAMNGEYGYCGDLCDYSTATFCGDGVISGGEKCDCGDSTLDATTDAVVLDAAKPYAGTSGSCAGLNGAYNANPNTTCAWDCGGPASYCGDATVDSAESCDGTTDSWDGALCCGGTNDGDPCSRSSDCPASSFSAGYCGYDAAIAAGVSEGTTALLCSLVVGDTSTNVCPPDSNGYATTRIKTCEDDGVSGQTCSYTSTLDWEHIICETVGSCGDGTVDSNEECDDGNDVATDECTTACTLNVCGDAFIYDGIEECDQGTGNGAGCDSAYESTCTACSTSCYYTTASGEFCGDGVVNGGEFCDGSDVQYTWYNGYDTTNPDASYTTNGTCTTLDDTRDFVVDSATVTYTCRTVGMCNGGTNNGQYCTSSYGNMSLTDDKTYCGTALDSSDSGTCEMPVCAASCDTTCPTATSNINLLLTTNEAGASGESDVDLYSYSSSSTAYLPNAATITVPACTVAGNLVADVDFANVDQPDVYVVFVTDVSGSMRNTLGSSTRIAIAKESIQTAIGTLYDELGDKAHIGLVHYSSISSAASCGTAIATDATTDTSTFLSSADADAESTLVSYVDNYAACGGTETDNGLTNAKALLDTVTDTENVDKIIILLSDGVPNSETAVDTKALELLKSADIEIYTLALTTTDSLETDMDRWSSNTICTTSNSTLASCDIDENISSDPDSSEDYNDTNLLDYSYSGSSSSEVESAYSTIIDSITKGNAVLLSSADGVVTSDQGSVDDSHNITLPWPSNFVCDGVTEQEVPVQVTFRGEETINISNVRIDYCSP